MSGPEFTRRPDHELSHSARTQDVDATHPKSDAAMDAARVSVRDVDAVASEIERARNAHAARDVSGWSEANAKIEKKSAAAEKSIVSARKRIGDASGPATEQLAAAEKALAEAKEAATAPDVATKPLSYQPVAREREILAILTAPVTGKIEDGFKAKEDALLAELATLSAAESATLLARLATPREDDPLAMAVSQRLEGERRDRLLLALKKGMRPDLWRGTRTLGHAPPVEPTSPAAQLADRAAPERSAAPDSGQSGTRTSSRKSALGRYLDIHEGAVARALSETLGSLPWPDPAADLPFTRQGETKFGTGLAGKFGTRVDDERAVRELLYPHDLETLLHQTVNVDKPSWSPSFGQGLAQLVERTAVAAYKQRVGPRIRAVLAHSARTPTADDIVPGHPIDPLVIALILLPGVLDFSRVAQSGSEPTAAKPAHVEYRFLGRLHPLLWNCALVSSNLTREQHAASLWRDPTKTTMAAMLQIWGNVVRIDPSYARPLMTERYPDERIGRTNPSEAAQIDALARTDLTRGDAPTRQFEKVPGEDADSDPQAAKRANKPKPRTKHGPAPNEAALDEDGAATSTTPATVEQLMEIEREIGTLLDAIRNNAARHGLDGSLMHVYTRRMERVAMLASADASKREQWLPVLQFQHTQLHSLKPQIAAITKQLAPLQIPTQALDGPKRGLRKQLERRLGLLVGAADASDLRDQSARLTEQITNETHEADLDRLDAGQRQLDANVSDARSAKPNDPGSMTRADTDEKRDEVAATRRQAIAKEGGGASALSQRRALVTAGSYALHARMNAARVRLGQLHATALEVYGDPEKIRKVLPNVKSFPDLVATVQQYLDGVERTWELAFVNANSDGAQPGDDPDEWLWRAKAAGLAAAQESFANIALDHGVVDFIQAAGKQIQDRRIQNALISFAATLFITVGAGMVAAEIGLAARAALAKEGATLVARGLGFAADVAINVSINSALQAAMATGEHSVGWMVLENLLMDLFTRGLLKPLHTAEASAKKLAGEYARLPHLSDRERQALVTLHTDSRMVMSDMVAGMATQWAARRLLALIPGSAQNEEQAISESFALTVLQQGAAIGLGKFFGGKRHAWKKTRDLFEKSRLGNIPELHSYLAGRDEFFRQAQELASSPSPDPAAESRLLALHEALNLQEQTLFATHGREQADAPADAQTGARRRGADDGPDRAQGESAPRAEQSGDATSRPAGKSEVAHKGLLFATTVGGVEYVNGGFFRVDTPSGSVLVEVIRSSGSEPRLRRTDDHVILEVPRGLTEVALERAIVGKLTEVQAEQNLPRRAGSAGSDKLLSPADMGLVAELRVLRDRHADQQAGGEAGRARAEQLAAEIGKLEARLGLDGTDERAQSRRQVVETKIAMQGDATRRARRAAELGAHSRIELHSHMMGVVHAEVFRQRAATAGGGKDTGSWVPLLERIASLDGGEFRHEHGEGGAITKRAPAGDAREIARLARAQIRDLEARANAPDVSPADAAAYRRGAEAIAEEAVGVSLAASPETDFNSAYSIRDQLVKDTFGGASKQGEKPEDAKQRAYDDYIREAVLQLARDNVGYSEQSVGVNKADGVLSGQRVRKVIADLVAEGKIAPGQVEILILGMLHTAQFGNRDPKLPPVENPPRSSEALEAAHGKTRKQMDQGDSIGQDIGAPETVHFDSVGRQAFQKIYLANVADARRSRTPKVLRPHVGEGSVDTEAGKPFHTDKDRAIGPDGQPSHYERSRDNIEQLIGALEELRVAGQLAPADVIIRFGHVTHATPEQAQRLRDLGVVAEVNLGSNVATGSISQTKGAHGERAATEQLDGHSFATLLYYDVTIAISTDGGAVMNTSLANEYARARQIIEDVIDGATPVRIRVEDARGRGREVPGKPGERELTIDELTPAERSKFTHGYEKLFEDAKRYYMQRPQPGAQDGRTAAQPYAGEHATTIAFDHGLLPGHAKDVYQGSLANVRAAAGKYRDSGYQMTETELAGGVVLIEATSPDGGSNLTLRSWPEGERSYLPHDDPAAPRLDGNEARDWYHQQLARIPELVQSWTAEGIPLEQRARRAYEVRRNARLAARERMASRGGVETLSIRDAKKYGASDGPSFDALVEKQIGKGKSLEEAYLAVIESSQRSDDGYDQRFGGKSDAPTDKQPLPTEIDSP